MKKQRLGEPDIKAIVLNRLRELGRIDRKSCLASEFRLGRTGVRADLAIQSDQLIGVEIKSELDGLRRLPTQMDTYRAYFDCTILVLATRHLRAIDRQQLVGIEVWECAVDGMIHSVDSPRGDPILTEPLWSNLMTQSERQRYLHQGEATEYEAFRKAFAKRFDATSREFWRSLGRRKIKTEDLDKLSRYRDARQANAAWIATRTAEWSEFLRRAQTLASESDHALTDTSHAA